jgi:hypothetical protein
LATRSAEPHPFARQNYRHQNWQEPTQGYQPPPPRWNPPPRRLDGCQALAKSARLNGLCASG